MRSRSSSSGRFLFVLFLGLSVAAQDAPPSDTDARIRYYRARLGGPGTYPSYARLGAAYLQKARETGRASYFDDAARYLEQSLAYQRSYEALLWLAAAELARHRFPEARAAAQEAVETLPNDPAALGVLFDSYLALGEVERGHAVLETLAALPDHFAALTRQATFQELKGNLPGAAETMQRACALADATAAPAESRAWCQVRLGALAAARCQEKEAAAAFLHAQALFKRNPLAVEHLAELRAAQGRAAEAVSLYEELAKQTAEPQHRLALAELYDITGKKRAARRQRARAEEDMRRATQAGSRLYLRPLAFLLLGNPESAREGRQLAEQDSAQRQDRFARDTLAWATFRTGQEREAMELYEVILREGSPEPALLLRIAFVQLATGDREAARRSVEQALVCPLALRPAERAQAELLRNELRSAGELPVK
jgi:tetratricopeptide (TPR) repeat protein